MTRAVSATTIIAVGTQTKIEYPTISKLKSLPTPANYTTPHDHQIHSNGGSRVFPPFRYPYLSGWGTLHAPLAIATRLIDHPPHGRSLNGWGGDQYLPLVASTVFFKRITD
eukprot:755378-Hanusia_phi.AAC.1